MSHHLFHLLKRGASAALAASGYKPLGIVIGICMFLLDLGLFLYLLNRNLGREEMKKQWKQGLKYAAISTGVVAVLTLVVAETVGVIATVYEDHNNLNSRIAALHGELNSENAKLEVGDAFDLANHLEQQMLDVQKVKIIVTYPQGSSESAELANKTVMILWDACYRANIGHPIPLNCEVTTGNPYTVGNTSYRIRIPPPPNGVIVHSLSDSAASRIHQSLSRWLNDVVWKQDMPQQMANYIPHSGYNNLVWVEFGQQVTAHKYIKDIS